MKYLESFKLFERKGNYQLFHKTSNLLEILKDGFIKAGGNEDSHNWWNSDLRKNIFPNLKKDKYKTISATRNLDYLFLPALELDVEKISDKYKIIPFSENPDYYLDFDENKLKSSSSKLDILQKMLRSKSKKAGKEYWKFKTDSSAMDYGISEEVILTDKLDVSKYVKRIILDPGNSDYKNIKNIINEKYPHIELVELDKTNNIGYSNINKAIRQKEFQKIKDFN